MNLSESWIRRPVMTTLVMGGILFFGLLSYRQLPINNLPDVDFPTVSVTANLPGANPETMASTVATPLEKQFSTIAGIESMTSASTLGSTTINIQFSLNRKIDAAALDVNSAIAAAMGVLPRNMPNPPTYQKVNPADMPIIFLAVTSESLPVTALNDFAENVLIAHLSSVDGVALVDSVPPQRYAVRVQVNPERLADHGIGIDEVASALKKGNVNMPVGTLDGPRSAYTLDSNGQLRSAKEFNSLIVAYQNGYPLRIQDLGRAIDGVENDRTGMTYYKGGKKHLGLVLRVRKQIGANTVAVADRIKAKLPALRAAMPGAVDLDLVYDQSDFIRESINDVQLTMVATIVLVVVVIFLFIRALKPTIIPSLVVPLSLVAVFPLMGLLGYTLNNLSLMALTLSIGFVVDDAVVVLENIIRRMEAGETAEEAALRGSREIGFTVLSMTVSLAIVFVPIMFMGGILGRLFREFSVCITAAILCSGFLSLTLTPMLASRLLAGFTQSSQGRFFSALERGFEAMRQGYARSLAWTMRRRRQALIFTAVVTVAMILVFKALPKGFLPTQDQYFFRIFSQVDDKTSYIDMARHQELLDEALLQDPDVASAEFCSIVGFGGDNKALVFVSLKPRSQRRHSVDEIIARLRPKLNAVPGLVVSLVNPPVITIGSRLATAQWQFTLQSTDLDDLYKHGALMEDKIRKMPALTDVKSDLEIRKPKLAIEVDRDKASLLGVTLEQVQDAFYSAYGARQVSIIYAPTNFYYVILEVEPRFRQEPLSLQKLYIRSSGGSLIPLGTVARVTETVSPLSVNHSGQIPAATIAFNLKPGQSIGPVIEELKRYAHETLPATISTSFQGTAQAFQSSLSSMGFLLVVTVVLIYLVLGILYESFIHPLTILTALPLAGFGALAALWLLRMELDMYAYVGIIMLVGIVKKNGIMMVDFALEAERSQQLGSEAAITQACLARFRPILMTTLAAIFGTLPIALGLGAGGEARQPLGVAVVGGLLFSQLFTLYITPVFYVYMDGLSRRLGKRPGGAP
ncbi:MAG: efflux RND transporter permease subunit [Elusimicrobia bacterium]|nr:efflux RND transporter permease subunit [Elusimicrobiota bacterium]